MSSSPLPFDLSDSYSSDFSGFGASHVPLNVPPDTSRLPISANRKSDQNIDDRSSSSLASVFSFREQSANAPHPNDAAEALKELFPETPSPLTATFVSDSDLPSVTSDTSEYFTNHYGLARIGSLPNLDTARSGPVTRRQRAEVYPDMDAEEALKRINYS